MTQKNLFSNVILLIAAITFSACSSSNDDANKEKHNWRLASIQSAQRNRPRCALAVIYSINHGDTCIL